VLIVTRKESESILIGDDIEVIVTEIGAERVKIGIRAPRGIPIVRSELVETRKLNKEASTASGRETVEMLKELLKPAPEQEKNN
jgi:carbon storage regulator